MHPTDGELLAVLDEWADLDGQHQLERHMMSCDLCRERQAELQRDRETVSVLLGALDSPVPVRTADAVIGRARWRRNRRKQLVAAAAALFVATAAAATMSGGGVHQVLARLTASRAPIAAPAPAAAEPADESPTGVALEPTDEVMIELAAAQSEGEIRIVQAEGPRVTVTASEPVPYTVQSKKVRLENEGSRASYRIVIPRDLPRVTLLVAGELVFSKRASAIVTAAHRDGDTFLVPLTRPGRTR
ncbi:MAG: hypothetical protein ABI766_10705 [Gemmatimonadales bacterium]